MHMLYACGNMIDYEHKAADHHMKTHLDDPTSKHFHLCWHVLIISCASTPVNAVSERAKHGCKLTKTCRLLLSDCFK
jgi:hypothetical protein